MDEGNYSLKKLYLIFLSYFKWIIIALIVGAIVGPFGTLFHIMLDKATGIRTENSWLIFLLPVAGVAIIGMYHLLGMSVDKGTNRVILAVRTDEQLTLKTAILIFVTTIMTHLFGGSAGREGAALQIGASISSKVGRIIKLDEKDMTIIILCGMSAGFGTLFGAPIGSAVFAMEVVSIGIMHYSAIIPCLVSAITGATISTLLGVPPLTYNIVSIPSLNAISVLKVTAVGMLCALVSILFCVSMQKSGELFKKYIKNQYIRIFVGGVIVIILTFIVGTKDYNGAGSDIIDFAFIGDSRPEAFILKIIFTAITLGAGFKGGEIVPVFFVGSTFGNLAAQILGLDTSFGAALGIIALFCGVTNCPLATLFLSIEIFGAKVLVYFAIVSTTSYILSGYVGIYSEQKILYSKTKPVLIDKVIGKK